MKVLKPGVEDILATDLSFLYVMSLILEFLNPDLSRASLVPIVGDIRASMMEEVDFRKEASNIQQFSRYLDESGMRAVATCPFVYQQWSTRKCAPFRDRIALLRCIASPFVPAVVFLRMRPLM